MPEIPFPPESPEIRAAYEAVEAAILDLRVAARLRMPRAPSFAQIMDGIRDRKNREAP
jgi:hypothetical protein